ncbi:hypothetical protein F5Y19DRAFT_34317 [Xylariaceae sp. FL1651]|nr:hypothetical protein F5Y19DRAFT_34317 [Xylariaceae sp. FL1651]
MMVADTDEPMPDAPQPAPAPQVAKPKRRFVPQLVEQTIKSSSNRKQQQSAANSGHHQHHGGNNSGSTNASSALSPLQETTGTAPELIRTTRDASVQVNDADMPDAPGQPPTKPIRRFAPVPIETTFDSYRVAERNPHGPAAEPTPDPSPTMSLSSTFSSKAPTALEPTQATEKEAKPKRRFAPQLIETTRRARRAGQEGPATKPTDKTDITPGTNHIYAPKPKRKPGAPRSSNSAGLTHAAEEGDDEGSPRFLTTRRQRSMKSHPNTRRSTRNNSYHPELDTILSSESGNSSEENNEVTAPALNLGAPALSDTHSDHGGTWSTRSYGLRNRRESCDEEFSGYLLAVAARQAHRQMEFEQALSAFPNGMPPQGVEHFFVRDNSEDDLQVGDEPPLRHGPSQLLRRKSTDPGWAVKEMRAHAEKLAQKRLDSHMSLDDHSDQSEIAPPPEDPLWAKIASRESRDSDMVNSRSPFLSAHSPAMLARTSPAQDKPFTPPPSGGLRASPFGIPFAFRTSEPEDRELRKMRKAASPPMLGGDLIFRMCPSPQHTRMEPNQPYSHFERPEERQRDTSGATGLWRGYCSSKTNKQDLPILQPPPLLHTPGECTPVEPYASSFSASTNLSGAQSPPAALGNKRPSLHKRLLSGVDERLKREMERKEREEALLAEFDDAFVTQVYNYISLGYAATARAFDDELSKISGICVEELRKDDNVEVGRGYMLQMEMRLNPGSIDSSGTESSGDERMYSPHDDEKRSRHKPPRWKALKLYIHEWARQHPALNGGEDSSYLAWGVRARRGSWAI